jgi:hypothetical protein
VPVHGGGGVTEDEWKSWVLDVARWHHWLVSHFRPARTERGWRTPLEGNAGYPDVTLARGGVVLIRELKSDRGRLAPEQQAWLEALGPLGGVWRPRDRDLVLATLTAAVPA